MKMKVFAVILIAVLFCACALEGVNVIGPAGGFVFYDKGNYSDGWRYLECSPVDAGQVDSDYIRDKGYTYDSVKIKKFCDDFVYNGYDDWRLPNDSELYIMLNAYKKQFELESSDTYYVSSENTTCRLRYGEIRRGSDIDSGETFIARPVRQF
jgi:hypothetical protein